MPIWGKNFITGGVKIKPRKWTAEEKLEIVHEGLKEKKPIAEICREHQISQALYYRWRDKFLEVGKKGLSMGLLMIMFTRQRLRGFRRL